MIQEEKCKVLSLEFVPLLLPRRPGSISFDAISVCVELPFKVKDLEIRFREDAGSRLFAEKLCLIFIFLTSMCQLHAADPPLVKAVKLRAVFSNLN